jgi:hypothetical protein
LFCAEVFKAHADEFARLQHDQQRLKAIIDELQKGQ